MTHIPHREELERRLGSVYNLDGSFGSLWAVECIIQAIRRVPDHAGQIAWIAPYMCDLFARAFDEMGMTFTRQGTTLHVTSPISYIVDVAHDLARLLDPPRLLPTFYKIFWLGSDVLGTANAPWYGLSTIFQNNSWARTDHDMIGNQRDRMDRAVPWLTKEYARVLDLPAEHLELARGVSRHVAWPPIGYAQNDYGNHNLPRLRAVIDEADAASSRSVLDAFVASQDRACQVLAARTALDVGIPPDTRHEAAIYQRVIQLFRVTPSPFIEEAIKALLAPLETPNLDADRPDYAAAFDAPPAQGVKLARAVLAREPDLPTFHCCLGWHEEQLGNKESALNSYDRAIAIKPDYAQALLNRGALRSMMGEHKPAAADFFAARELQPENVHLMMNLLVNHFMSSAGDAHPARIATGDVPGQDKGLREVLRRYGRKQIDLHAAMRALSTFGDYMVPSLFMPHDTVHKDGVKFSDEQSFPGGELWVFSDREAADRAQAERGTLGLYSCGQSMQGVIDMFAAHPFSRLRINPVGPEEEGFIFLPEALTLMRLWMSGISVEHAASKRDEAGLREALWTHGGLLVAVNHQSKLVLTQMPEGLVAHIAATIDRSSQMCARLGEGVMAVPIPPGNLVKALQSSGADRFLVEGSDHLMPSSLL